MFQVIADQDLAGPLVFCLLFGASLLLHGKVRLLVSKNMFYLQSLHGTMLLLWVFMLIILIN